MSNNKLSKSIIWAGFFAIAFGIGFIGVRALKLSHDKNQISINDISADNSSSSISEDSTGLNQSQNSNKKNEIRIEKDDSNQEKIRPIEKIPNQARDEQDPKVTISATKPKLNGDTYEFVASVKDLPSNKSCHFELWSNKGVKVQSSNDGNFSGVPGISGGRYTLWLVDSNNNRITSISVRGFNLPIKEEEKNSSTIDSLKQNKEKTEKPPKMLITKDEFQSRLLNPNDLTLKRAKRASDKKSLLSNIFNLVIIDMKPNEAKIPTDLEGVREKIHFEAWKSATVVDISYDENTGQVTKPVY